MEKALKPARLLLRGARLVDPAAGRDEVGDLAVVDGRLAAPFADPGPGDLVLELAGKLVLPGLLDMHVHLRDPGQEEKETMASAAAAARAGGVTALAAMPNTAPPADTPERVAALAQRSPACPRVLPIATMTVARRGREPAPLAELARAGAVAFSDDGDSVPDAAVMRRVLEAAAATGRPAICHCEEPSLVAGGAVNEGPVSRRLSLPGRPAAAEAITVARDLELARLAGARVHIAHLSTAAGVDLVRRAKAAGLAVTAEATHNHLLLEEGEAADGDPAKKLNPPLRSAADRQALLEGLLDGTVDAIASDHAPHTPAEKARGMAEAPAGVVGLEVMLPAIITGLVRPGIITWLDAARLLSLNPARILGQAGGSLAAGRPANLALVDPEAAWTVEPEGFFSRGRACPFTGRQLFGKIMGVVAGGEFWPGAPLAPQFKGG